MVRHFLILENSETEFSVDPRNGRRNNTTRSSLAHGDINHLLGLKFQVLAQEFFWNHHLKQLLMIKD